MRLEVTAVSGTRAGEQLVVRAALVNDSYAPVAVSRNAFIGPDLTASGAGGMPLPPAVEPTYGQADEPLTLQPFSLYGRDRFFDSLAPGEHEFSAEYTPVEQPAERLRVTAVISVSEPGGG
jgi:hypothetical protein